MADTESFWRWFLSCVKLPENPELTVIEMDQAKKTYSKSYPDVMKHHKKMEGLGFRRVSVWVHPEDRDEVRDFISWKRDRRREKETKT